MTDSELIRLQKVLASAGFGSRRSCEELISDERVKVNGDVAILGQRVDVNNDVIEVDGLRAATNPDLVYYLLNKPAGVVTTAADPQKRKTVMSLVPSRPRVFSVGRLDMASEGLLIMTNDGELTQRLTHPSFGIEKEYMVELNDHPSDSAIAQLRNGVELVDGFTSPARVTRVGDNGLQIVLHEGKNREVRRMCEAVGYRVRRLVRTRIGSLRDQKLAPGKWRALTSSELSALQRDARGDKPKPASSPSARAARTRAESRAGGRP